MVGVIKGVFSYRMQLIFQVGANLTFSVIFAVYLRYLQFAEKVSSIISKIQVTVFILLFIRFIFYS